MSTEYELRAKNRKAGAGKKLIMTELDQKMQLAARALLMDGTDPHLWIAHDRGTRDIRSEVTSIFIEHTQIGLCIPFEISDGALASGTVKLPDGVLPGGFQVQDHELTLYGTCPDCAKARR